MSRIVQYLSVSKIGLDLVMGVTGERILFVQA